MHRWETAACRLYLCRPAGSKRQGLRTCNILTEYNGNETDFADALADEISSLRGEEVKKLVEYAEAEAFGNAVSSEEKRAFSLQLFSRASGDVYSRLNPLRKFGFKYIKCFK